MTQKRGVSLTTRAFLFSFLPLCLVLAVTFAALNTMVQNGVKRGIRDSLQKSEELLVRANEESAQRIRQFAPILAQNPGLKAAIGLANQPDHDRAEVRRTIEAQLAEIHSSLALYDFLAVTDWQGQTMAAVEFGPSGGRVKGKLPEFAGDSQLMEFGDSLYSMVSTPIIVGDAEVGNLRLGSRFDLNRYQFGGEAAVIRQGRIIYSTYPRAHWNALENLVMQHCESGTAECEVNWEGENYLVLPVRDSSLGADYRLLEFRSLDRAFTSFTNGWTTALMEFGFAGILLAMLFTLMTSRSVSRPLRDLVAQLKTGERSRVFPQLKASHAVTELQQLAGAFNQVAAEVQRSQDELEKARMAAESANRLKSDFMANISHELRTPMNGILGMTDILLMTPLDDEQRDYASTVRNSADGLMVVISDILDISRLESGNIALSPAPFDLRRTISDIVRLLSAQAAAKRLNLMYDYSPAVSPRVVGDALRIRQILTNLIGNAIKFTHEGEIEVRVERCRAREGNRIRISVRDTGIGIAPEKLGYIFGRFTQVEGHMSRKYGGLGLGLAIVKELVEMMNGTVSVESRFEAGSTFSVELPLENAPNSAETVEVLVAKEGRAW